MDSGKIGAGYRQWLIAVILAGALGDPTVAAVGRSAPCSNAIQFYQAASADARTLEQAMFITRMRHQVEQALHRQLSDRDLRALADRAREEAHYWFKYMEGLGRGCAPETTPAPRS